MAVLIACNLLWAGTYVTGKVALHALSSVELNCLRFGIASLLLLPLLWRDVKRAPFQRSDAPYLVMLCLLGFVLNKATEYTGLALTSASDTALLIASESIFTALLAWMVLRERVRRGAVIGLLLGAVGVYLVIEHGLSVPHLGTGTHVIGDLLVVLALVFEALYTVLGKAALTRFSGLTIIAACSLGSMAFWIPAAAIEVARDGLPHLDGAVWFSVVYLAVASTVLAAVGWLVALRYVDAAVASVTLFIQPIAGTLLAILVLSERPSWGTVTGGICIAVGVWVAGRARDREAVPATLTEATLGTHA